MIAKREALCERLGAVSMGLALSAVWAVPLIAVHSGAGYAWLGLLFAAAYVLLAESRRFVRMFVLFVALHAALAVGVVAVTFVLTRDNMLVFTAAVQMLLFIVTSFAKRLRNRVEMKELPDGAAPNVIQNFGSDVPSLSTLLFTGAFIVLGWLLLRFVFEINAEGWQMVGFGALLFVYFVCKHVFSVNDAIVMAERVTNQPTDGIVKFNNRIGAMVLAFVALCMLVAPIIRMDRIILFVLAAILTVIQLAMNAFSFLISLIPMGESSEGPPPDTGGEGMDLLAMFGAPEAQNDSNLPEIIMYIVLAAIVVGIIALVVYLVVDMYRRFSNLSPDGGYMESRTRASRASDSIAGTGVFGGLRAMAGQVFGNSARMKVRRLFYKKVHGYGKKKGLAINRAETSTEIAEKLSPFEDVTALRALYDKARYDEAELTKEELSAL